MKAGYAAIIGKPNTGKSTLLNRILSVKLSAVTHKAQTTRSRIIGIYNDSQSQIIFMDTPGLIKAKNVMEKLMTADIDASIKDADILLHIVDDISNDTGMLPGNDNERPCILIINKMDRMNQEKVEDIMKGNKEKYTEIIPLCAITGDNVDILIERIKTYLPYDHAFYPEDYLSDKPEKFFVSEFIREELFLMYGEEVPYSAGIVVEEFRERDKGKIFIRANIYIEKDSHKGIIIGAGGKRIKELGIRSRKQIEGFLNASVYLELNVKVRKNWKENSMLLRRMWNT